MSWLDAKSLGDEALGDQGLRRPNIIFIRASFV